MHGDLCLALNPKPSGQVITHQVQNPRRMPEVAGFCSIFREIPGLLDPRLAKFQRVLKCCGHDFLAHIGVYTSSGPYRARAAGCLLEMLASRRDPQPDTNPSQLWFAVKCYVVSG